MTYLDLGGRFIVTGLALFLSVAAAFDGTLQISDLVIDAPFEADSRSTTDTTILCELL